MTELKKGQHYDEDPVTEARALIASIRRHLDEERCNHSLREIVEDGRYHIEETRKIHSMSGESTVEHLEPKRPHPPFGNNFSSNMKSRNPTT